MWKLDGLLAPDQVSRLRFVVRVEANNAEPIVSQGYRIMAEGWDAMVNNAVTTQVLLPTPTSTPLPTPVPPTSTPLPTPVPPTATSTPSPTPIPPTARSSPTLLPTLRKDDVAQTSSFRSPFGWAGLLAGSVIIVAALMPFLMRLIKKQEAIR